MFIDDVTEAHARGTEGVEYGEEYAVPLASGAQIRFNDGYARVVDDDGRELMYWTTEEFQEDPNGVLMAFLGLARATG